MEAEPKVTGRTAAMPQNITSKLFVPRTAEMLSPFLDLDENRQMDGDFDFFHHKTSIR